MFDGFHALGIQRGGASLQISTCPTRLFTVSSPFVSRSNTARPFANTSRIAAIGGEALLVAEISLRYARTP